MVGVVDGSWWYTSDFHMGEQISCSFILQTYKQGFPFFFFFFNLNYNLSLFLEVRYMAKACCWLA